MTLAPSYSIPMRSIPTGSIPTRPIPRRELPFALSLESSVADVSDLVDLATRLDAHAVRDGGSVSAQSMIAKAFLVASLRHPAVDARWPLLPARHGLRLSELTAALDAVDDAAESASLPDDAAILSVGAIAGGSVELRLAFDPRRTDAREAHRLIQDLAGLLSDPWQLVAAC